MKTGNFKFLGSPVAIRDIPDSTIPAGREIKAMSFEEPAGTQFIFNAYEIARKIEMNINAKPPKSIEVCTTLSLSMMFFPNIHLYIVFS